MNDAVVVAAVRTAVGKAIKGTLANTRPDDMGAVVVRELLRRAPGLDPSDIDDVIFGCAMPEAEQGLNVARIIGLRAGLPYTVPAMTINRFCSSGIQAIAIAGERIMCGSADTIIAGGAESMSMVPMSGNKLSPNPQLVEVYPEVYLSMGLTAEYLARKFQISREEQDRFACLSHQNAVQARSAGHFRTEIVPLTVAVDDVDPSGRVTVRETIFDTDEGPRPATSPEVLAGLRPVFQADGSVTAGNSSQMSDGAAAVLVMSADQARARDLKPLARFVSFATAGVPPEEMGIGPVEAVPKALKLAGLTLDEIDLIELNEAFAVQALAVIRLLGLDPEKVNVNGGAIALGHPLGCTGAKLTATIIQELHRRCARYGMVTMCIGGGMGAAGIFERIN
ncbi:MAG: acetyl-CoA C-acyltransferase [Acidobacteria bacterium]|nr:acetyl-CoA C-acyltransferase [Acidobacteriota bacterium]